MHPTQPSCGNAVVPMDSDGETLNEAEYRRILRYMSDAGTNVFVGGPHATEFVNMDDDERLRLWEISVDELNGRGTVNAIPLGPASTHTMISWFKRASQLGFDGAQLYPGAQDGRGNDGLFVAEAERYFRDVLEASDLPVYLCGYHGGEIIDSPNGQVPYDLLVRLVTEYPHITGVTVMDPGPKPAAAADLQGLIAELGSRPLRLAGGLDWYERMELGVYGFHSIQQSIAPTLCSSMIDAFQRGDRDRARELSALVRTLNEIIHDPAYYYPRSIKPTLRHLGFDMGIIRRPYLPLSASVEAELVGRIDALGLPRIERLDPPA